MGKFGNAVCGAGVAGASGSRRRPGDHERHRHARPGWHANGTEDHLLPEMIKARSGIMVLARALVCGAGDENRTRTISLGSSAVTAARGADQASLAVPSDPGCSLVTLANGTLMARRTCSIAELRQEFEVFHVVEDAIVRHEGNLEPDRCRSHPAVRLMLLLAQAVPGTDTPCAERRICLDKVRPRPDDLRPGYLILQPPQFSWAPPG